VREYVIVGTPHGRQESQEFAERVVDLVSQHSVSLVAEEYPHSIWSPVHSMTSRAGVPYIQIDPTEEEWGALGISREMQLRRDTPSLNRVDCRLSHADAIREDLWLRRIEEQLSGGRVLVVCGYLHVHFLADAAAARGSVVLEARTFPPELLNRTPDLILSQKELDDHVASEGR
jgi:hypothetical protein